MPRSPCSLRGGRCESYTPGHAVHAIQARLIGESPWGWRDGLVEAWEDGGVRIRYADEDDSEDDSVTCWHHRDLSGELPIGAPVRVHERFHVLGIASGWYCVEITGGLGAVPEPDHPALWVQQIVPGIVEVATGIALPMDRPEFAD
jgi:hypothetical protein